MKKRYLLNIFSVIFAAVILLPFVIPGQVSGWSAVIGNRTHSDIDDAALKILSGDPAFKNVKFPDLKSIQDNDWVNPATRDGTGPDVLGRSNASAHFYNPRLETIQPGAGGAPDAVKDEFTKLVNALSSGKATDAAHAASWAAHYIADISMPYHTQGAYRADIMKIYTAAGGRNAKTVPLPAYITGPMNLSTSILDHPNDFKKEIEAFIAATANHTATEDWFDPWYWDGRVNAMVFSSHVVFEGETFDMPGAWWAPFTPAVEKYSDLWTNLTPSFDNVVTKQAAKIREFARQQAGIAQRTTDGVNGLVSAAPPYLESSIEGAATVWRASFTGLAPAVTIGVPDKKEPQKLKVTGTLTNSAGETVKNVQLRLTVTGGTLKSGEAAPKLDELYANWQQTWNWDVEATNLGYCTVKLEVIGSYKDSPDLQYAVTQSTMPGIIPVTSQTTSTSRGHSIVFCLDNSSSMSGQPILDAMNAGVQAVNAVPSNGLVEMALYFFGTNACDPPVRVVDFTINKDRIKTAINTASARGNTPLAAAITAAGSYIKSGAQGQEATIILLTDGMETCQGDPVAAARALNPNLKLKTGLFTKPLYAATNTPIKLQVVGFNIAATGTDAKLKEIALAGNGKYYPATGMQELVQALTTAVKEATGNGIQIQTWWFIAGGAVLLLILIISLSRRGKHTPAPVTPPAAASNTAPPQTARQPAVSPATPAAFCPYCGTRVPAGAAFCTGCGKPLAAQGPVFCPGCGTPVTAGSAFCGKCGSSLASNTPYTTVQAVQPAAVPPQPPQAAASPKPVKKASGGWWLLAIIFLLPGGLIAWAVVKKGHPKTASALLMVSMLATALVFYSVVQNLIN